MNKPDRLRCAETVWITPDAILECARAYFGGAIPLDPATEADNPTRAERFYAAADDGLAQDWTGLGVWLNPPFGKGLSRWIERVVRDVEAGLLERGALVLLPINNRVEVAWWQRLVWSRAQNAECYPRGRVHFLQPQATAMGTIYERPKGTSNLYACAVFGFGVDEFRFEQCFELLGRVRIVRNKAPEPEIEQGCRDEQRGLFEEEASNG